MQAHDLQINSIKVHYTGTGGGLTWSRRSLWSVTGGGWGEVFSPSKDILQTAIAALFFFFKCLALVSARWRCSTTTLIRSHAGKQQVEHTHTQVSPTEEVNRWTAQQGERERLVRRPRTERPRAKTTLEILLDGVGWKKKSKLILVKFEIVVLCWPIRM